MSEIEKVIAFYENMLKKSIKKKNYLYRNESCHDAVRIVKIPNFENDDQKLRFFKSKNYGNKEFQRIYLEN